MKRELTRLRQLIDLLALSQATVGRLSLRLEPVNRRLGGDSPLVWRQQRVSLGGVPRAPDSVLAVQPAAVVRAELGGVQPSGWAGPMRQV
jgi:hypothetical protein